MAKDWAGYNRYEPEWFDSQPVREVVRSELVGEVLAFPSGKSPLATVSADIDQAVSPDVLADVTHCPFKPNSFDTVYCDPPYALYWGSQDWITDLWNVARKKLILQTPTCRILLHNTRKRFVLVEPARGSARRWIRTLQIFEPANETLG